MEALSTNQVSIPLWCDCDQGDIKLLKCLAWAKASFSARLYFSTFFPFCQIGKDGKWANFAVDLRSPPKAWGVDGKWACCKIGWIAGNLALKGSIFG